MIGKLVFLAALLLVQGRPEEEGSYEIKSAVPYDSCPKDQTHYLLPHEYDCTKFYYCEYGFKWLTPRDCAPGTQFSAQLQVCIHPILANCTLPGSSTEAPSTTTTQASTTTPAPTTTTTAAPTTTTTPEPTTTTTTPEPTTTTTTPEPTTTTTTSEPTTTTTTPEPTTTTTTPKPTTVPSSTSAPTTASTTTKPVNPDEELLDNGCPADFNIHKLLPHEAECNKFYYCVHGKKVERQCAPGTYFNPKLQVCDWSWNVDCAGSGGGDGGSGGGGGGGGGTLPNGCPANFSVHQLLPHESNCSKFYYCVFGDKVERDCPPNTHFNPALQVCDWPNNAGCASGGDGGGNGDGGGGDGGGGGGGGGDGGGSGTLPNGCPANFSIHQLLPHESNCSKFYYCVFGNKVERECPLGTHFNPKLQVCDWPDHAGCAGGSGGGGDGDGNGGGDGGAANPNPPSKCETGCNVLPWSHETECDKFWRCDGGTAVLATCSEGLHFNPQTFTCDFICNVSCTRRGIQSTPQADGLKIFLPWDKLDPKFVRRYLGDKYYI